MAGDQVSSQGSSACSSRAVSLERKRHNFNEFIHLKPSLLSIDCTVKEYNKWETSMTEWLEHAFPTAQQSLIWVNFKSCIDTTWLEVLERTPGVASKDLVDIFKLMDTYLLQQYPLITRRLATIRIQKPKEEGIADHLHKLVTEYNDSKLDDTPVQTRILLHLIKQLGSTPVEEKVKGELIERMRVQPDITDLAPIFTFINNVEGDEAARKATLTKTKVNVVLEQEKENPPKEIDCRICGKRHQKRKCTYVCPHCRMKGSHKKDFCWTKYPHLKKGGDRGKRDRSSDRSRKSRSRSREDTPYVRPSRRVTDTSRDSSVERSPSPKQDKKKKKDKRRSKSRRVRSAPKGLQGLQPPVQAAPSGSSTNSLSIFEEHFEPPIIEANSRPRRIRKTRAQAVARVP